MPKYKVKLYVECEVEADSRDEAIDEAERRLGEDMESHLFHVADWFKAEVQQIK